MYADNKIHKRFMVIHFQLCICNFSTYLYSYSTYTTTHYLHINILSIHPSIANIHTYIHICAYNERLFEHVHIYIGDRCVVQYVHSSEGALFMRRQWQRLRSRHEANPEDILLTAPGAAGTGPAVRRDMT